MKKFLLLLFLPSLFLLTLATVWMGIHWLFTPTKMEVLRELEQNLGQEAFPAFAAQEHLITSAPFDLIPLSGPSNSWVVFCRENQDFLIYRSDRHGFHNPDSIWESETWDSVFLGDSFVQGACVPSNLNFVRLYESQNGVAGNLGSYGNGPLTQLASLIEYAKAKKPKKVFWVYIANDLYMDLNLESESSILMDYLDSKSQNLIGRQTEMDQQLKKYLNSSKANQETSSSFRQSLHHLVNRLRAPQTHPQSDLLHYSKVNWILYHKILKTAADLTRSWQGEFYFVILPNGEMLLPENKEASARLQSRLKAAAFRAGAQVLNLYDNFIELENPLQYFENLEGRYGHFTVEGYKKASQFLMIQ